MNLKQKLTYMLIGSLFTLAGYFLASLANNQPPNAQDNTNKVFEKIVCKELVVVNDKGERGVWLFASEEGGWLSIDNTKEKRMIMSMRPGLLGNGFFSIYNKKGQEFASLSYHNEVGGMLELSTPPFTRGAVLFTDKHGGALGLFNKEEKIVAGMAAGRDGHGGVLELHNKNKTVVIDLRADAEGSGVIKTRKVGTWKTH